jgi:hypothetical protein
MSQKRVMDETFRKEAVAACVSRGSRFKKNAAGKSRDRRTARAFHTDATPRRSFDGRDRLGAAATAIDHS